MNKLISFLGIAAIATAAGCDCKDQQSAGGGADLGIKVSDWGKAPDGSPVQLYTLTDGKGMTVRLSNWGAIVQAIEVPDREGNIADVVLGFDSLDQYVADQTFQGAAIGRYGNRIGGAKFTLDGTEYKITDNENGNCLHGGTPGYHKMVWKAESINAVDAVGVKMTRLSPDGENGFPGNLNVSISFILDSQSELVIHYEAVSDKATPVNLTHHMYYNLTGSSKNSILGHELKMLANRMTPVDAALIPTGEITPVKGTPFDFQSAKQIGADIEAADEQLKLGGGYDHNFVFEKADGQLRNQVTLHDPQSGRTMEILTTEPAIQFYSGNFMKGAIGKDSVPLAYRTGLCLETQHYPDSPNKVNFPSTILKQGDKYESTTILRFSAK
ncbi:MAG: galactose mutarotase [Opitutales bacterium]|nr:galactose mutarotase [Opitutales bacterium]